MAPDPLKSGVFSASAVTRSVPAATRSAPTRNLHCWSKIPTDLLRLVFERLGFTDFQRAKSVCSSWESVSRQSEPKNQIPWLIIFAGGSNYCLLLNPEEKEKLYKTQDLGNDFAEHFCVATYNSWLLMCLLEDYEYNLYILNVLTRERIILPSLTVKSRTGLTSPLLWIDDKTKDHLVVGMIDEKNAVSFKKEDDSWKPLPQLSGMDECFNMVYKDHKLYCLSNYKLDIFDFSGEFPVLVSKTLLPEKLHPYMRVPRIPCRHRLYHSNKKLVVTVSGDILIVKSTRPSLCEIWKFEIYKMDSSKGNKWQKIVYLRDEAILLDLGITVLAKDMEGIKQSTSVVKIEDSNAGELGEKTGLEFCQMIKRRSSSTVLTKKMLNIRRNFFIPPFHFLMFVGSYQISNENDMYFSPWCFSLIFMYFRVNIW